MATIYYPATTLDGFLATIDNSLGAPLLPRDIRSDRLTLESVVQRGQFAELMYAVGEHRPT